jgi:hypothetical protein
MRNTHLAATLLLTLLALSGQTQVLANTEEDAVLSAARSPSTSSSPTTRIAYPLPEALLGHWVTDDGRTHYYFSADELIIVNWLENHNEDAIPYKQTIAYNITTINEGENRVRLEVATRLGWAQSRLLHFAPDRQALTESMTILGHSYRTAWTYVDNQQQPSQKSFELGNG